MSQYKTMQTYLMAIAGGWELVSLPEGDIAVVFGPEHRADPEPGISHLRLEQYGCTIVWTPGVPRNEAIFWGGRLYFELAEHEDRALEGVPKGIES